MADSDLKIFIVGPKKAGKTVFACMLNNYVSAHPESGVLCKVGDWITKAYFSEINEELSKQKWPLDTLPLKAGQEYTELKWEWEFGCRKAFFDLVDPAGEDIERAMRGEGNELPILVRIRDADVLFVLVDLHGHQGDTVKKRAQNGWIIENVLRKAEKVRRLVIGISKGDLLEHQLPTEAWTDKDKLMALMAETMPEFNLTAYRSQLQSTEVQMVMFSAVTTESYLNDKGVLESRPGKTLESQGLEPFVKAVTEAHDSKKRDEFVQKARSIFGKVARSKIFWVLIFLLLAFWHLKASYQPYRITFVTSSLDRAGTDAQVYLKLIGDKRESWRIKFDGRGRSENNSDLFEEGSVDVFERDVWDVGTISEVVVGHDDSGTDEYGRPSGGWHLEKIEVQEWRNAAWGPKATFPCGVWLDQSTGYGIEMNLPKKGY